MWVDMLIFQHHLPHVISNSMQALLALSHLEITFQKTPSQHQHASLKLPQRTKLLLQIRICPVMDDGKIF